MIGRMATVLNRADQLNSYWKSTRDPGFIEEDVERYRDVTVAKVRAAAERWLGSGRLVLSAVPEGQLDLQVGGANADSEVAR